MRDEQDKEKEKSDDAEAESQEGFGPFKLSSQMKETISLFVTVGGVKGTVAVAGGTVVGINALGQVSDARRTVEPLFQP